uniref:Uncharacterized protein n=1 Tax=Rhizophora mucronata TaxID=61149 RepID=A0A2P2PYF8_RHIMU
MVLLLVSTSRTISSGGRTCSHISIQL